MESRAETLKQPRRFQAPLVVLGAAAAAMLVYFDLGPALAFNDDWIYSWSVRQFVGGHGLRAGPEQAATAVLQTLWGAVLTLGHPDQQLLRLSILPMAILAGVSTYKLARELGADQFWSRVAGLALVTGPLFLSLSTSYMTDIPYTALLVTAAWLGVGWIRRGEALAGCVVVAGLATLERQAGVAVPLALTVGLLLAGRERSVARREWGTLALLWVVALATLALPPLLLPSSTQAAYLRRAGFPPVASLLEALLAIPGAVGLLLVPFAAAIRPHLRKSRAPWIEIGINVLRTVPILVIVILVFGASPFVGDYLFGVSPFFGDYVTPRGLGPPHVHGPKPQLFGGPIHLALAVLAVTAFYNLAASLRSVVSQRPLRPAVVALLVLAAAHLFQPIYAAVLDRYYLPIAACLIPLAAGLASRRTGSDGRIWAVVAMALALGVYAAGEQDYQAWQQARDIAARLAYTREPPARVDAGYEANGVYATIPLFERTGQLLGPAPGRPGDSPSLSGPAKPCLRLMFAPAGDARPGASYSSLASGRIVIMAVDPWASSPRCR